MGNSQELGDSTLFWEKQESILSLPVTKELLSQNSSLPKLISQSRATQTLPTQPTRLLSFCCFLRRENSLPRGFWMAKQKCLVN